MFMVPDLVEEGLFSSRILAIFGYLGLFIGVGMSLGNVIIVDEYFLYYREGWWFWRIQHVWYGHIQSVQVDRGSWMGNGELSYSLILVHTGPGKSPLELSLDTYKAETWAVILDAIARYAPQVVMNELAQEIRAGTARLPTQGIVNLMRKSHIPQD